MVECILRNSRCDCRNRLNDYVCPLTSATLSVVRQVTGWILSYLKIFTSTAVIIISSLTLHSAYKAFEQGKESLFKILKA